MDCWWGEKKGRERGLLGEKNIFNEQKLYLPFLVII